MLKDSNGTKIADSVSCVYNTRFDTSLLTFKGEITRYDFSTLTAHYMLIVSLVAVRHCITLCCITGHCKAIV